METLLQLLCVRDFRRSLDLCLRLVDQSVGYVVCVTRMLRFVGAFANAMTGAITTAKSHLSFFPYEAVPSQPYKYSRTVLPWPHLTIVTPTTLANMPKRHKKSEAAKKEHEAAVEDIITHFAATYISTGNDNLITFQQLCEDLDVEVGTSMKKCKQVSWSFRDVILWRANSSYRAQNIKRAYVNIHDFVRVQKTGGDVSKIKYTSYKALRNNISSDWRRRFPLERAKGDEVLKAMLIKL